MEKVGDVEGWGKYSTYYYYYYIITFHILTYFRFDTTHLCNLILPQVALVVRGQRSVLVAVLCDVVGGAVAVGWEEHGHLQVVGLVQGLLPAAGVGGRVRVRQQGLHLP